jgi:hypothetical protein
VQCAASGVPQSALDAFSRAIDSLVQRYAKVINGDEEFSRWLSDADSYIRVWRNEPAEQRAASTWGILGSTASATAGTVVQGGAAVLDAAQSGWVWGLAFVALGALVYLKVMR